MRGNYSFASNADLRCPRHCLYALWPADATQSFQDYILNTEENAYMLCQRTQSSSVRSVLTLVFLFIATERTSLISIQVS